LNRRPNDIIARLAGASHGLIELCDPYPILFVGLVFYTLSDAVKLIICLKPFKAVSDEPKNRMLPPRLDPNDHHP
jgi:hypothetical protein